MSALPIIDPCSAMTVGPVPLAFDLVVRVTALSPLKVPFVIVMIAAVGSVVYLVKAWNDAVKDREEESTK